MTEEQWHQDRLKSIGSSEAATIIGVNEYSSPLVVWAEKTGRLGQDTRTEDQENRLRWGKMVGPLILDAYARLMYGDGFGYHLSLRQWPQNKVVRHPRWPDVPMHSTPDAIDHNDDDGVVIVEMKNCDGWAQREWRDGCPLRHQVQVQHQMACMPEAKSAVVVAHFGGGKVAPYPVDRNERFITTLEKRLTSWWEAHIVGDEPPPADGSKHAARVAARLHPEGNGRSITLDEGLIEIDRLLVLAKLAIKWWTEHKEEAESYLKSAIGPYDAGILPDGSGRYTWRNQRTGTGTQARVLRRSKPATEASFWRISSTLGSSLELWSKLVSPRKG